jgi:ferredoxin
MRITADADRCEGHGLCVERAPELFDLDDDAVVVVKVTGDLPEDLVAKAESGVRVCPVAAQRAEP